MGYPASLDLDEDLELERRRKEHEHRAVLEERDINLEWSYFKAVIDYARKCNGTRSLDSVLEDVLPLARTAGVRRRQSSRSALHQYRLQLRAELVDRQYKRRTGAEQRGRKDADAVRDRHARRTSPLSEEIESSVQRSLANRQERLRAEQDYNEMKSKKRKAEHTSDVDREQADTDTDEDDDGSFSRWLQTLISGSRPIGSRQPL